MLACHSIFHAWCKTTLAIHQLPAQMLKHVQDDILGNIKRSLEEKKALCAIHALG